MSTQLDIWQANTTGLFTENGDFADGIGLPGFTEVDKAMMVGIPHVIIGATFWVPTKGHGMVSCECVIGTAKMLDRAMRRGKIGEHAIGRDNEPLVEPEETVVYNDGGTGIRRQLVSMFHAMGLIDVGNEKFPETGELGVCRWDAPWTDWNSFSQSRTQGSVEVPYIHETAGGPLRILSHNGLRVSDYNHAQYGESVTYYL